MDVCVLQARECVNNLDSNSATRIASPTSAHVDRAMAPSDELSYLKDLVGQLNAKIASLEQKAKDEGPKRTPREQLRMILVGPPGAGA